MTRLRILLRRTRTLLWTAFSIVVILAAVIVGVGKLLMPYSDRYQPQLEAWLSEEFGRPVTVERFEGEWNAFGPRLRLNGMRLQTGGDSGTELAIEEAALDVKPLNALLPGRPWYNFLVIGAEFSLVEDDAGFRLSGLGRGSGKEPATAPLKNFVGIGELILEESTLEYAHPAEGVHLRLEGFNARVQIDDESAALTFDGDLADREFGRVFGQVEGTAVLRFDRSGQPSESQWHLGIQDLRLESLQRGLPDNRYLPGDGLVNGEFWGDWLAGRPLVVHGVGDLRGARLDHADEVMEVEHANARVRWVYGGRGDWRLDLSDLRFHDGQSEWRAADLALSRDLDRDVGLWIGASSVPLDAPLRIARFVIGPAESPELNWLPVAAGGDAIGFDVVLDAGWGVKSARGQLRNAHGIDGGDGLSLAGLDADFDLADGEGSVTLHSRELTLDWPGLFGNSLSFSLPSCRLDLKLEPPWQLAFSACEVINEDIALGGDVVVYGDGGRPSVQANVLVTRARLDRLQPYWPEGVMKPRLVQWLRAALVEGEIEEGRVSLHGDMDDWPFREAAGRFEATARVAGATLEYRPDWPAARAVDASLRFTGTAMWIESENFLAGDVAITRATAGIGDFKRAVLELDYAADSTVPALMGFLVASPVLAEQSADLARFRFGGSASTRGTLRFPFGRPPGEVTLTGTAAVADGSFEDEQADVRVSAISGELDYDRGGLRADRLEATFRDQPASLGLRAQVGGDERFGAVLSGSFDVQSLVPRSLSSAGLTERFEGSSEWRATVSVPAEPGTPFVIAESLLEDTTVSLPAPLSKVAGEAMPVSVRYPLTGATRELTLSVGEQTRLVVDLMTDEEGEGASTVIRALAALGGVPAEPPPPGFLRVVGSPESFDLDGWTDLVTDWMEGSDDLGELSLEQFDIDIGRMRFLDRMFEDVGLLLVRGDDGIRAEFDGTDIDGHVLYTTSPAGGSLTAEFERLALNDPLSSGIDMQSNPADFPALHLYARSFRYAGIEMGETRIEAYPTADGFHFEKVESESEELTLRAAGDWSMQEDGPRSDFRILVTAESLGDFLESVDISSSLSGGQTVLRFNAWWPGSPAAFALSRLNGEVEFSVTRGQITNASAGTGRLLGLLSVQALPRRLALDFRDVFDTGFDFEEAHGTFQMHNGLARTDDVELSSSAAKISLSGQTDLVGQRYDQVMTVQPGVGNTLPVLGAIAGGPGGAAAGLALQGLLHDELGEATQVRYTITGSWEDPLIEPVLDGADGGEPAVDG